MFKYILGYLCMHKLPPGIKSFAEDPGFWRALRDEALFFALDGLVGLLNTTYSCSPDKDLGKRVLHLIGTKKNTEAYKNPYRRGDVNVACCYDPNTPGIAGFLDEKELFIQYRHKSNYFVQEVLEEGWILGGATLTLTLSNDLEHGIVLDLCKIAVSPTHFLLRLGGNATAGGKERKWNFEGLTDRKTWTSLHKGTEEDKHKLCHAQFLECKRLKENLCLGEKLRVSTEERNRDEVHCDYLETHYHHTWVVNNKSGEFFATSE